MTRQRTYWHLGDLDHKPNDYEIGTSRLLYHPQRGFEVTTPLASWFERYVGRSALVVDDWERFRDPRETTYTKYVELQSTREIFVDGLLEAAAQRNHDAGLDAEWVQVLDLAIGPLRFPVHGLQMVTGYVGHLAPSGRIVVTCLFQAGDEMRRIQRLAYRLRELQDTYPELGKHARTAWETDPMWQPLRRVIERLLVSYDWGEALVALDLCVKPVFDALFGTCFAELARASGDDLLAGILFSLDEDVRWHREWIAALVRMMIEARPDNRSVIQRWIARWDAETTTALAAFAPIFGRSPRGFAGVQDRVAASLRDHRRTMGLEGPRS